MHIIVGSGITGLMCARILLEKKVPGSNILLIEKSSTIGGLLSSIHYPGIGYFDFGIHTFYDTDIPELSALQRSILPEDQWIFNKGVRRDYGGSYFNGKLQFNSSYVDIRSLPKEIKQKCIGDFFDHLLNQKELAPQENALDLLTQKFGNYLAESILSPIIEKTFQNKAENLHPFAANLLPLNRVVMFDEAVMDDLSFSPKLCSYLAYTEQLKIPSRLVPTKQTYYPKQYGMIHVVKALQSYLEHQGVRLLTQTEITGLNHDHRNLKRIQIKSNGNEQIIENIDRLYWTGPLPQLGGFFPDIKPLSFDKPLKTFIVNMLLKTKDLLDGMFYAYCFEKGFSIHRVSSPYNLCPSSLRKDGYPFSAEIICADESDTNAIKQKAVEELLHMGCIEDKPFWIDAIKAQGGYPNLTCKNVKAMISLKDQINSYELSNLQLFGGMTKSNLFYQTEILTDIYQTIMS